MSFSKLAVKQVSERQLQIMFFFAKLHNFQKTTSSKNTQKVIE